MSGRPICFVVGARPNFMKVAPVMRALAAGAPDLGQLLVHTGQHYDAEMSEVFLSQLGLPIPDVLLEVGSGTHAEQTARALTGIEKVLLEHQPGLVVVPGDVNSTLAGALAAVKLGIDVAHLEAGLRSFDSAMPEEHNRRLTDHLSSVLLAHSASAVDNLAREGITDNVHLVGNTMIDSLMEHVGAARAAEPWLRFGVSAGEYGLVTLHRPALVDDDTVFATALTALAELSTEIPLIFPVHPRARKHMLGAAGRLPPALHLSEPLGYLDFLGLEAGAHFVLTDSGGVQEETSVLGVPCFTLRDTTERPVTVELGTNVILGRTPDRIREIPTLLQRAPNRHKIPLWDGAAGTRAAAVLADFLE
jgi:UDP-N-acetylglucosamine 2-epimerase (non-hydrolysing)